MVPFRRRVPIARNGAGDRFRWEGTDVPQSRRQLGTGVLTKGTRFLNQPQMVELTRQIASLHHQDKELIVCTSGAQAAGRALLDFPALPSSLSSRQMLAAVGQSRLMLLWGRFFEIYGILVGQILLTRADTENRQRFLNARDTFNDLIKHRIVPVVNENDAWPSRRSR